MLSIKFEEFTLSNGLKVILHVDDSMPMVAVNVWYHVGSKDEEIGRTGFAHLFEHVMFEGSKHHNRNYFEPLQKIGAEINGSTTSDRTNYWETVPSNQLDLALWLEADRMGFLLDALDQERFDIQRDVVKNERRQSYENRPYGSAHLLMPEKLYPSPHPYGWPVIGSQEDLNAASLSDVQDFFRRFYAPSNASIVIAGDVNVEEVRHKVELYFGDIPPGPPINRIGRMASSLVGEVSVTVPDSVQLSRLVLAWPTSPLFGADDAPLEILAMVLGEGKSSRLYRSLVYDRQIARDVSVGNYAREIAGEFHIQATVGPGHNLEEAREVVDGELERLRREPISDQEMNRAQNQLESQHVHQLERLGGFGGKADQLNYYNVLAGDPGFVNTDLERFAGVSRDDIMRVANSVLGGNCVRVAIVPEADTRPTSSSVDRTAMPRGSSLKAYVPPAPTIRDLPNGLKLMHVENRSLPVVAVGMILGAGAISDPAGSPGLAHMTAALLTEGTKCRSSQEIADELESVGTYLAAGADRENVLLSIETLTTHWPIALDVIVDVVRNSTFPAEEIERVRKERLADLSRISDDPVSISLRASRALVYGPDTGYGHSLIGTEESVSALTRDQVTGHFEEHYGSLGSTLVVAGDVSLEEVFERSEELFGDWTGSTGQGTGVTLDAEMPTCPTTIYLADKPGAAQSVIRAGHLTIDRHHPDYYGLVLLNYVFGGHPMARLFMNLRQDKGYSYGYSSSIAWAKAPSVLLAGGAVDTAVTKESVSETLKEFSDIRGDKPVSQEELRSAKDGILMGFPGRFETQGQVLQQMGQLAIYGLDNDYYTSLAANLEDVNLDQLHSLAASRILDEELMVLVVGDATVVEPGLREFGFPVVAVDHEGRTID